MNRLLFAVGSFLVAICSILLFIAVLTTSILKRPLSVGETAACIGGASAVGMALWFLLQRRLARRRTDKFK
jgi:divalent metal cation (Fe/Co/Zn/Cd) transporter